MTTRTRVKICGITNIDDAKLAAALGADAIGLVFYEKSPRLVSIDIAASIVQQLSPLIKIVGLFVDAKPSDIQHVLSKVPLDLLQFHGEETDAFCQSFGKPYIKAIKVSGGMDIATKTKEYPGAQAYLFDTYHAKIAGGTGMAFDWTCIPESLDKPLILAGGLTPKNIKAAIHTLHPYAVDVSSGIERSPGQKDAALLREMMNEIKDADQGN